MIENRKRLGEAGNCNEVGRGWSRDVARGPTSTSTVPRFLATHPACSDPHFKSLAVHAAIENLRVCETTKLWGSSRLWKVLKRCRRAEVSVSQSHTPCRPLSVWLGTHWTCAWPTLIHAVLTPPHHTCVCTLYRVRSTRKQRATGKQKKIKLNGGTYPSTSQTQFPSCYCSFTSPR